MPQALAPAPADAQPLLADLLGEETVAEHAVVSDPGDRVQCAVTLDALIARSGVRTTIVRFAAVEGLRCTADTVSLALAPDVTHSYTGVDAQSATVPPAVLLHAPAWMPPRARRAVELVLRGALRTHRSVPVTGVLQVGPSGVVFVGEDGARADLGEHELLSALPSAGGLRLQFLDGRCVDVDVPAAGAPLWSAALTRRLGVREPEGTGAA